MSPTTPDPGLIPAPAAGATPTASPVLSVSDILKAFRSGPPWHRRRVEVLRGASLEVRPGELVGLVGENGSGKGVLMQVIVGLVARDGEEVSRPERLGYCPQLPLVWDKLTVAEHFKLFATACRMSAEAGRAAAKELMDELGFARYEQYRVETLSAAPGKS